MNNFYVIAPLSISSRDERFNIIIIKESIMADKKEEIDALFPDGHSLRCIESNSFHFLEKRMNSISQTRSAVMNGIGYFYDIDIGKLGDLVAPDSGREAVLNHYVNEVFSNFIEEKVTPTISIFKWSYFKERLKKLCKKALY